MFDEFTIWIENSIGGFLYIVAGFFFFLFYYSINDLTFLDNLKDYQLYIFLGVIVSSSILGFSAQKILENIIYFIRPKFKYNAEEDKKLNDALTESLQKRLHNLYVVLVLYRHLILGTFAIWISLLCWLTSSRNMEYRCAVSIICILLILIFIITYRLHSRMFKSFKEEIRKDIS